MTADALSGAGPPRPQLSWPVVEGAYIVGDPAAPVAVCALTSDGLLPPLAALPGVAIAGQIHTANLGVERLVTNVTANPAIRFLLLCGKESVLFRPGQTLCALVENGIDEAGQIVGAQGYQPVLRNIPRTMIDAFRRQVELVDWTDEHDTDALRARITELAARTPRPFKAGEAAAGASRDTAGERGRFAPIRLGGTRREPLAYDPKGFFVITVDRAAGEIVVRHYLPDNTPAHEARGRTTEPLALALLREGLVSQLSHAAYLGAELAKAETALRLGARYEQDRPLRADTIRQSASASAATAPPAPAVAIAQTWDQLSAIAAGDAVNVVVAVTEQPAAHVFAGVLAEPQEANPFQAFRRTAQALQVYWEPETRVAMGTTSDIAPGALVRVRGVLRAEREVNAEAIAILTHVATLEG